MTGIDCVSFDFFNSERISNPFMSGMIMSSSIRSGFDRSAIFKAEAPFFAV
jgi:hypothetical protein